MPGHAGQVDVNFIAPLSPASTKKYNGKVERSHRVGAEEFHPMLRGVVIDDTALSARPGSTDVPWDRSLA
jgi:hypothetical protein